MHQEIGPCRNLIQLILKDMTNKVETKHKLSTNWTSRLTKIHMFDVILALWIQLGREAISERRPPGSNPIHVADIKNKI